MNYLLHRDKSQYKYILMQYDGGNSYLVDQLWSKTIESALDISELVSVKIDNDKTFKDVISDYAVIYSSENVITIEDIMKNNPEFLL